MRKARLFAVLAVAAFAAVPAMAPAGASAAETFYCGEVVPAKTDCAISPGNPGDWYNGTILVNVAEYQHPEAVSVCEHTYERSNGATVSDRCANKFVSSETDLDFYWEHSIELSGHAGNNSANPKTIWGDAVH